MSRRSVQQMFDGDDDELGASASRLLIQRVHMLAFSNMDKKVRSKAERRGSHATTELEAKREEALRLCS